MERKIKPSEIAIERGSPMIREYGSPAGWSISRTDKLTHAQTILYEIDMLRYPYDKIPFLWREAREADLWVYLESFLLHYRNLVEFFGKAPRKKDDLSIQRPAKIWPDPKSRPTAAELAEMQDLGEELRGMYEDSKKRDTISKYLQHCTEQRIEAKSWEPREMIFEMERVMQLFEKHMPAFRPASNSITMEEIFGKPDANDRYVAASSTDLPKEIASRKI
jgi:hypothetical protein